MKVLVLLVVSLVALVGCAGPATLGGYTSPPVGPSGVEWYTPMPNTLNERERNQWGCEQIDLMNRAFSDVLDEAYATNQEINVDRLVTDYIGGLEALSVDLDTSFGDYLTVHAEQMEAEYFNPDPTDYEETAALGEALNNGEAVDVEDNSLVGRCIRLGVDLTQ